VQQQKSLLPYLQLELCARTCRWETGYWGTMDIAHDRAGYYLCWGCLNWVPAIYTSPALYLTEHPLQWPLPAAAALLAAGAAAIYINYDSDRQRQVWLPGC
jgi:7-dehydrocholesterol reductase